MRFSRLCGNIVVAPVLIIKPSRSSLEIEDTDFTTKAPRHEEQTDKLHSA